LRGKISAVKVFGGGFGVKIGGKRADSALHRKRKRKPSRALAFVAMGWSSRLSLQRRGAAAFVR